MTHATKTLPKTIRIVGILLATASFLVGCQNSAKSTFDLAAENSDDGQTKMSQCPRQTSWANLGDCQLEVLRHLSDKDLVKMVRNVQKTDVYGFQVLWERAREIVPRWRQQLWQTQNPCKSSSGVFLDPWKYKIAFEYLVYLRRTNQDKVNFKNIGSVKRHPLSGLPVVLGDHQLLFQGTTSKLSVYNTITGQLQQAVPMGSKVIKSLITLSSSRFATFSSDWTVEVWEWSEKAGLKRLNEFFHADEQTAGPADASARLTILSTTRIMSSYSKWVYVWDLEQGQMAKISSTGFRRAGDGQHRVPIPLSDGSIFISGFKIGDSPGGKFFDPLTGREIGVLKFTGQTTFLDVVDSDWIVRKSTKSVELVNLKLCKVEKTYNGSGFLTPIRDALGSLPTLLAYSSLDSAEVEIQTEYGQKRLAAIPASAVVINKVLRLDYNQFMTISPTGAISFWNLNTLSRPRPFAEPPLQGVKDILVTPGGQIVVMAAPLEEMKIFDPWE